MVENVGVAAKIASKSLSGQQLFLLPVCIFDSLRSRGRPTSGYVVSGRFKSGMVENVGLAAEVASKFLSVQTLFVLPVCIFDILRCRCRPTSYIEFWAIFALYHACFKSISGHVV